MSIQQTERPYFEEHSEAMVRLEEMVDAVGFRNVLAALSHICFAKGEHLRSNWQDEVAARSWDKAGRYFDRLNPPDVF